MRWKLMLVTNLCIFSVLQANEDLSSEFSHFAGGAVLAGGATAIVDHYYPEYRSDREIIGFGISAIAVLVDQSIQYAEYGNMRGQLLDTAAHLVGSALGAWITDGYILSPVIQNSPTEGKYLGMNFHYSF